MSWISDAVFSLLMTSVTGSILIIFWMAVKHVSREKIAIHYIYLMLRLVLAGYLFTFIYLVLHRFVEYISEKYDDFSGYTPILGRIIFVLFVIWVLGMGIHIVSQINMWVCFRRIKKSCIIAPKEYAELLQRMCSEMGIRKSVSLYHGYGVKTPFICGVRKPKIFLPIKTFSIEELEMILYHELVHYKQGDTFWKPVFGLMGNIYWFSPFSWILWREAVRWTEANCDSYCCENKFDKKKYFLLLLDMGSAERFQANGYAPMWTEGGEELKWRINCMKKFNKKTNIIVAVVIATVSIFTCGVSVYASTQGVKRIYQEISFATFEGTEEPLQVENELQEHSGTVDEFAGMEIVEEQDDGIETYSKVSMVNWTVNNKTTYYSKGFNVRADGKIVVTVVIEPSDRV